MNLHGIVRGAIQSVNPDITASFQRSNGFTVDANHKQIPAYASAVPVRIQSQAMSGGMLKHADRLNLQGVLRSLYMFGNTQGIVRPTAQGGDLLTFKLVPGAADSVWKVVEVVETWPDWSHVLVCLQT